MRDTLGLRQLRQTDYRLSDILARDKSGREVPVINVYGCLWRTLISFYEREEGEAVTITQLRAMYYECVRAGVMSETCFVNSHVGVGRIIRAILKSRKALYYVGMDQKVEMMGRPPGYYNMTDPQHRGKANYRAEQIAIRGAASHFRDLGLGGDVLFDPYPQLANNGIMSIRLYYLGRT